MSTALGPAAVSAWCVSRPGWRLVQASLWASAVLSTGAWLTLLHCACRAGQVPVGAWLVVGLLAAASAALSWRTSRSEPHALFWDGRAWHWQAAGAPVVGVRVAMDLGSWMLLRLDTVPRAWRWQALHQQDHPGSWPRLRAALYWSAPGCEGVPTG